MIGGISYFHTYAYDLLATNERIIAASCDAAIEAHATAAPEGHLSELVDGVRVGRLLAVLRGTGAASPAAPVVLRLPEAGRRVLRPAPRMSSTGCRTRSCARSTASGSASGGRSGDVEIAVAATSSWP